MPLSTAPTPSATSKLIAHHSVKTESQSLAVEILHNLQYQHSWTSLSLHTIINGHVCDITTPLSASIPSSVQTYLVSGLPPKHGYLHPDFQNALIRQGIKEDAVAVQREWVLPMSIGEKWTLARFARVFDALPERNGLEAVGQQESNVEWKDSKRVLMGMMSAAGRGGDGTIVYYIMQEGAVKPRQNG